jgi:putative transposase
MIHHPQWSRLHDTRGTSAARADILTAAYTRHPERFVRKHPEPPTIPAQVWINPPDENSTNP